jgi:Lectin C-type domain
MLGFGGGLRAFLWGRPRRQLKPRLGRATPGRSRPSPAWPAERLSRWRAPTAKAGSLALAWFLSAACSLTFEPGDLGGGEPEKRGGAGRSGASGAPAGGEQDGGGGGGVTGGAAGAAGGVTAGAKPIPTSTCGDGVRDEGEACDEGARNGPDFACSSECRVQCPSKVSGDTTAAQDPRTNRCYALVTTARSFEQAERACRSDLPFRGFQLASIRTDEERQFVLDALAPASSFWVGLHDPQKDSFEAWAWVDGSPYDPAGPESELWGPNEPEDNGQTPNVEDGEEECVALGKGKNFLLIDTNCGVDQAFLCLYAPPP